MLPVMLGLGLINVNAVIDSIFASRLIDGSLAPTAIDKAFRVYMLPQGVFSVAVATVLFPSLSRLATRGDLDGFRDMVSLGLRQICFLLIPASVVSAVLAEPMIRLLYQRGAFDAAQTRVVAGALAAFCIGLTFNGMMLLLNRAFFSLQSNWIPTAVALANLGANAVLDAVFYRLGVWGIPLATSVVNIIGTTLLFWFLRRRLGHFELGQTAKATLKIVAASVPLAIVSYGIWRPLDDLLGRSALAQIASLGSALVCGGVVYFVGARALGVRELDALLALRRRSRPA
jgi:putative peptidoglycan lipid II flippase